MDALVGSPAEGLGNRVGRASAASFARATGSQSLGGERRSVHCVDDELGGARSRTKPGTWYRTFCRRSPVRQWDINALGSAASALAAHLPTPSAERRNQMIRGTPAQRCKTERRRKAARVSEKKLDIDPHVEAAFQELGVRDPAWSAKAHARGDAILARTVFARSLWDEIAMDGSDSWRKTLGWPHIIGAIEKLLEGAGSEADLAVVLRQASVNTLMSFVSVLDRGEAVERRYGEIASRARWGLFEVDEEGEPLRPLESWQGLVRNLDPSGRMAEPPGASPKTAGSAPTRPPRAAAAKIGKKSPSTNAATGKQTSSKGARSKPRK